MIVMVIFLCFHGHVPLNGIRRYILPRNRAYNRSGSNSRLQEVSMSIIAKRILVTVLCLPGALVVGFFGTTMAAWALVPAGHLSVPICCCWVFWGGFGGASLGATAGLILGSYYRMKWVYPFLGASFGTLISVFLLFFARIENGPLLAALVLLGCIFGSLPFLTGSGGTPK